MTCNVSICSASENGVQSSSQALTLAQYLKFRIISLYIPRLGQVHGDFGNTHPENDCKIVEMLSLVSKVSILKAEQEAARGLRT
jgi:hypothetical protein